MHVLTYEGRYWHPKLAVLLDSSDLTAVSFMFDTALNSSQPQLLCMAGCS